MPRVSAHSPDCKGREAPDAQSLPSPEFPGPSRGLNDRNQCVIIYSTYQPLPNPIAGLLKASTVQALASTAMLLQFKVTALWDYCNRALFWVFLPSCPSSFSTRTKNQTQRVKSLASMKVFRIKFKFFLKTNKTHSHLGPTHLFCSSSTNSLSSSTN